MNAILSIVSFILALFIGGDTVQVRDWRVGFEATPVRITAYLDPTFVFYSDETPGSAWTFGSAVCINSRERGALDEAYILHHEMIHVAQYHALGLLWYPASLVLPLEWWPRTMNLDHPEENDAHMWTAPSWWPDQWHFLRLELRMG